MKPDEPLTLDAEIAEILGIKNARISHLETLDRASQRMLTRALHENRVHAECLEIAMEALRGARYSTTLSVIERRLAELEPEEETG